MTYEIETTCWLTTTDSNNKPFNGEVKKGTKVFRDKYGEYFFFVFNCGKRATITIPPSLVLFVFEDGYKSSEYSDDVVRVYTPDGREEEFSSSLIASEWIRLDRLATKVSKEASV